MFIESPDEMFIEPDYFAMDIRTFILSLPEPKRSICQAVILEGEKIADVRKIYGVTRWQLIEIIRDALMPLARDYRIGQFRQNDGRVTGKGRGLPRETRGDRPGRRCLKTGDKLRRARYGSLEISVKSSFEAIGPARPGAILAYNET